MKKTLLIGLTAFIGLAVPVKAQLQKGTKYVAATINFSGSHQVIDFEPSVDNSTTKFNTFNLSPSFQFGKFVRENRLIGIGVGTNLYFTKGISSNAGQDYVSKYNNLSYNISPFIRNYKSLSTKWAIFLNSSVILSYMHYYSTYSNQSLKRDGYSAGLQLTPGISYWITPRFALETDLNFLSLAAGYQKYPTSKSLYFNSALTTNLTSYFSVRASWYLQKN